MRLRGDVRERPIIFSGPMICALLREARQPGTGKMQTRRVLKPDLQSIPYLSASYGDRTVQRWEGGVCVENTHTPGYPHPEMVLPYVGYAVGDRLWVREAHMYVGGGDPGLLLYRATWRKDAVAHGCENIPSAEPKGWRSPIHMPRALSRLTLIVTDVRVERLNDISEADAIAEGMIWQSPTPEEVTAGDASGPDDGLWIAPGTRQGFGPRRDDPHWAPTAACAFRSTWNSLHGPDAWAQNPWVCAVSFTVHHADIDSLPLPTGEARHG